MGINKNRKRRQYTNIPADILRNPQLSLRDRGLLVTLLSLPENWKFSVAGLQQILPNDGKHSITVSLNRLEQLRYLTRKQVKTENGKFSHSEWEIYEEPCGSSTLADFQSTENTTSDKPSAENLSQSNMDILITTNTFNMNQSRADDEIVCQEYKEKWGYHIVAEKVQKIVLDTVCSELFERRERDQVTKKELLEICEKIEAYDKPISNLQAFAKKTLDNYFAKKIVAYKSRVDEYNSFMKNEYDYDELEEMLLRN